MTTDWTIWFVLVTSVILFSVGIFRLTHGGDKKVCIVSIITGGIILITGIIRLVLSYLRQ